MMEFPQSTLCRKRVELSFGVPGLCLGETEVGASKRRK